MNICCKAVYLRRKKTLSCQNYLFQLSEIEDVLKGFKKDKIHGPDGWPVEFFLHFFQLVGHDILKDVIQSPTEGRVSGSLNATFITLIPKCDKPLSFANLSPISLCNLVYKVISKLAANRHKPILDRAISWNQFGFLHNRQIVEPIGITQEVMHTVKVEKRHVFILKLDLVKAFDRVNWTFLKLVLLQIGVPLIGVNWILGCVESCNFVVLVNGTPSKFFPSSRGIRQGCPLSLSPPIYIDY